MTKRILGTFVLIFSMQAHAEMACQSEASDFIKTYRESVSDCNDFGNRAACDRICSKLGSFNQAPVAPPAPVVSGCQADELRLAAVQAERVTLDRVRADMNAEGVSRATAFGANDQDCINKATARAQAGVAQAIQDCNNKSTYFKSCAIVANRVIQAPSKIVPFRERGKYDEMKTDEATCKRVAQERATQAAIATCRSQTGADCTISTAATPASHKTEKERRYGLFGPKDEYHKCESFAEAMPIESAQFKCTIELSAKNQF